MNIYLIAAESYRLIEKEIKKIVKKENYLTMNLKKVSLEDILKEASYYGIGDSKKIIVVSDTYLFGTNKITEKESNDLINYLNQPNENTTLIFTTQEGIDLRKKQTKLIKEKYHLINILPLTWKDKENELRKYVQENKYTIDNNAVNYIMNNTVSLDMIYNELDKIFLFYQKPSLIKYDDVKNIVGSIIDNNNFHFVSAVVMKNLKEALKLWQNLKVYKVEPLTLVILLAREYRNMYYLKRYQAKKFSMREICRELNFQDWQVNKLYSNALSYTEEELLEIIQKLADIDLNIKTGKWDKEASLMRFLIEVCN